VRLPQNSYNLTNNQIRFELYDPLNGETGLVENWEIKHIDFKEIEIKADYSSFDLSGVNQNEDSPEIIATILHNGLFISYETGLPIEYMAQKKSRLPPQISEQEAAITKAL